MGGEIGRMVAGVTAVEGEGSWGGEPAVVVVTDWVSCLG